MTIHFVPDGGDTTRCGLPILGLTVTEVWIATSCGNCRGQGQPAEYPSFPTRPASTPYCRTCGMTRGHWAGCPEEGT